MSGRSKRRSSNFSYQGTPAGKGVPDLGPMMSTPLQLEDTVESEAAERRGRVRIQKRQSLGHPGAMGSVNQTPAADTPIAGSAAAAAAANSAVRSFTAAQLSEHYANCMKLSAENKINAKNAFHLQLIDYMTEMMRKKASDLDNFQAASCALDASAKIYAYRVDSVHNDTLKLAGGVGKSNEPEQKADGAGGDEPMDLDEADANKKVKKKKRAANTIEKNLNNINCNKFDLEFDVDPLFKKTSAQFDSGGGGGCFLSELYMRDDGCQLLLDSNDTLGGVRHSISESQNACSDAIPQMLIDDKRLIDPAISICPTFSNFSFKSWNVDDEKEEEGEELKKDDKLFNDEHCFDADAPPMMADDDLPPPADGNDSFLGDDDNIFVDEIRERHDGGPGAREMVRERGVSLALMENLREHLLSAPSEYSYFDHGRLGAWAGPRHWKFKPMSRPKLAAVGGDGIGKKKDKKNAKVLEDYEFEELFSQSDLPVLLESVQKAMRIPKRPMRLQNRTMEKWEEDKLVLPKDLHYKGKDFAKLYLADFHVSGKPVGPESQSVDDTVDDYDFDNENDAADFCPATVDDAGDANDYGDGFTQSIFPTQTQGDGTEGGEGGMTMVSAPNKVEKIQIGYAKQAKKMDMRRLKSVEWKILQSSKTLEKENMDANAGEVILNGIAEADENDKMDSSLSFSDMYKTLKQPNRMPPKMVENLSVPLAFVALLHLCNEKSLALEAAEDLSDFVIQQG